MFVCPLLVDTVVFNVSLSIRGRSGAAKVLGQLSVPGRPTNLDNSRARAYLRLQ